MPLSRKELTELIAERKGHDPFRTWRQRNDQLYFRSLYVKHEWQLEWLGPMFEKKLARLVERYEAMRQGLANVPADALEEALGAVQSKIERIALKARDTQFEIRGRVLDTLKRNPIGTTYYCDLDAGNNANDGLSPEYPWLTIEQYTTTSVRSPGDILYVRAGTSEIPGGDINHDEDGTITQPIYIIGASSESGEDPWGDAVDTKPIIDFNNGAYTWYINDDFSWEFQRLSIEGSGDNAYDSANLSINSVSAFLARSCVFRDRNYPSTPQTGQGVRLRSARARFIDCDFEGNRGYGLHLDTQGEALVYRSRFNGAAETQDVAVTGNGQGYFEECDFGQTTAHDLQDLGGVFGPAIFKACRFNDFDVSSGFTGGSTIYWEDCTGTPTASGSQWQTDFRTGKSSTIPAGESGYSIQMAWLRTNYDGYGSFIGLALGKIPYFGPLRLWLDAGSYTIKVKIRADAAWSVYPTAAELFLRAKFYDDASSYSVGEAVSDEVLSDGSTWVDFEVSIVTGREGPVYLDVFLDKFETGPKGIYVFPFPSVS